MLTDCDTHAQTQALGIGVHYARHEGAFTPASSALALHTNIGSTGVARCTLGRIGALCRTIGGWAGHHSVTSVETPARERIAWAHSVTSARATAYSGRRQL